MRTTYSATHAIPSAEQYNWEQYDLIQMSGCSSTFEWRRAVPVNPPQYSRCVVGAGHCQPQSKIHMQAVREWHYA